MLRVTVDEKLNKILDRIVASGGMYEIALKRIIYYS